MAKTELTECIWSAVGQGPSPTGGTPSQVMSDIRHGHRVYWHGIMQCS